MQLKRVHAGRQLNPDEIPAVRLRDTDARRKALRNRSQNNLAVDDERLAELPQMPTPRPMTPLEPPFKAVETIPETPSEFLLRLSDPR